MSSIIKQLHFKKNRLRDCRFMAAVLLMVNVYKHIICKADIIINKDSHIYSDASDGKFKSRQNNHTNSFYHRHQEQDIKLSKHIWQL